MRTIEETRQVVIRGRKKANRNEEEEIEQSKVYEKTIRPEKICRIKSTSTLLQHDSDSTNEQKYMET